MLSHISGGANVTKILNIGRESYKNNKWQKLANCQPFSSEADSARAKMLTSEMLSTLKRGPNFVA